MKEQIQRDILFELCKDIAMNKRTPDWIKKQIYQGVKKARDVKEEFPSLEDKPIENRPLKVGDKAYSETLDNSPYMFEIVAEKDPVQGVRLFDVRIISGKGPRMVGSVVFNMPETWLQLRG